MRKEVATPRRLPPKGLAQRRRLHGQQYQAVLAGPVLGGAGLDLVGAGKVDEAVGAVLRRALVAAGRLGRRPLFAPADMIRSEERRVRKECVGTVTSRWATDH